MQEKAVPLLTTTCLAKRSTLRTASQNVSLLTYGVGSVVGSFKLVLYEQAVRSLRPES